MAKKKTKAPERRLFRVRTNRVLLFPPQVVREVEKQIWLRSGGAVDLTDEVLWEMADGQRHKLEPMTATEFGAAQRAGLVWTEEGGDVVVLRHLKEQREAAVLPPPPAPQEKASRGAQTSTASIGDSAPPTPEAKPKAERRAADVEAALAEDS